MFSTVTRILLRPHTLLTSTRPLTKMAAVTTTAGQIHTAACLIIGDEVLNGKTVDVSTLNQTNVMLVGLIKNYYDHY
jgi:hypothetical protein